MTRRVFPEAGGRPIVHLHAGQVVSTDVPTLVTTVLGSCVSVTMFSRRLKAGAICHAQFPRHPYGREVKNPLLYADTAVENLFLRMKDLGAAKKELEVKIFGASSVIATAGNSRATSAGRNNSEAALEVLARLDLPPEKSLLHGDRGMRIFFFTDTGEVLLRQH